MGGKQKHVLLIAPEVRAYFIEMTTSVTNYCTLIKLDSVLLKYDFVTCT